MPSFYFHVCNGAGFVADEEGQDLPHVEAARAVAVRSARDVMAGELRDGRLDLTSFIEVEDEAHNWLFTLSFADAVAVQTVADPKRRPPR